VDSINIFENHLPIIRYRLSKDDFDNMYGISGKILLTGYELDNETQDYLASNPDIPFEIPRIVEVVHKLFKSDTVPSFEIIKDEESFVTKHLAITFSIQNKTYDEILAIWTIVSKQVYSEMDILTAKKIAVLIDG